MENGSGEDGASDSAEGYVESEDERSSQSGSDEESSDEYVDGGRPRSGKRKGGGASAKQDSRGKRERARASPEGELSGRQKEIVRYSPFICV